MPTIDDAVRTASQVAARESRGGVWALVVASAGLVLLVMGILFISMPQNGGVLVYALDDPYIHMAIARSLSEQGVWGITPYAFSASSSSLLWTGLLAALFRIFGVSAGYPLLLTLLSAGLVLVAAYLPIAARGAPGWYVLATLTLVIFLTPVPALVFSGQEHLAHIAATVLFAFATSSLLSAERLSLRTPGVLWLAALAPVLTMLRYEGLFLVFVACVLLALRRAWRLAVFLGVLALAPLVVFGIVATANGWSWIPNSVLLKGNTPTLTTLTGLAKLAAAWLYRQRNEPHVLLLNIAAVGLLLLRSGHRPLLRDRGQVLLLLFLGASLLHMEFAQTGWFYRYEAYIVALGLVVLATVALDYLPRLRFPRQASDIPRSAAVALLALLVALPFAARGAKALKETPEAMNDRFLEHFFQARFTASYYNHATIALSDIGTTAFYTHARILDVYGLGSMEPVRFRNKPEGFTEDDVYRWTQGAGAKVAILQVEWPEVAARIPKQWKQVGEWQIPRNVVFGDTRIGFFAIDPAERETLIDHLREFARQVPPSVKQSGAYMQ